MNDQLLFEERIASLIAGYANQAPTAVDPVELTRLISTGRRSRALPLWPMARMRPRRLVLVMVAAALALLMLGLFVGGGGFRKTPDPSPGPRHLGIFEPLPTLAAAFIDAALLPDGRVWILEAGGEVEYFDPSTDRFVTNGPELGHAPDIETDAGLSPSLLALLDGRILLTDDSRVGGPTGPATFRLLVIDPSTGSVERSEWRTAWPEPTTTLLEDGRALVIGSAAEIFDPSTGHLTEVALVPDQFPVSGAIRIADGRVLVLSRDRRENGSHDRVQVFDPSSGTFGDVVLLPSRRGTGSFTMTALPDGTVLIAGGLGSGIDPGSWAVVPRAELFDPVTGTVSSTSSMQEFWRSGHGAALLADGRVLIMGGIGLDGEASGGTAEIFNPATGVLTPTARMRYRHAHPTAITLADGRVLILSAGDLGAEMYR